MAETALTDAEALAFAGTIDSDTDFKYHTVGESTYYHEGLRQRHRILTVLKLPNAFRVYKDGELTFGVRAGLAACGADLLAFAGADQQALTDDATNYVCLTVSGGNLVLTTSTTGFPDAADTPHIPLVTIEAASGAFSRDDIADYRPAAMYSPRSAMTADEANTLVAGSSGDDLHVHAPRLAISAGAEAADKRTITIQARDAADDDLPGRLLVRVWVAASDYGPPDATGNTVAVETGTTYELETANAACKLITDADGKAEIGLTVSGAASRYVLAEIDGRIYSSGEVTWDA